MNGVLGYTRYLKELELTKIWLVGLWPAVPLGLSALYLILIYVTKKWMDKRKPMRLRVPLIAWNTCLAVFSILAFIGFTPSGLLYELGQGGFVHSVCLVKPFSAPELNFWSSLFILSKFVEFGDTFFLVFKKSPLTFLHVYHHVTVAMYTWFGGSERSSVGHWFCAMNYGVHSVMYTYFMLKALGINVPSVIARSITTLQLSQFFMGLLCILVVSVRLWQGKECNTTVTCAIVGLIIYGSYVVLFLNFFYHRYVRPRPKKE